MKTTLLLLLALPFASTNSYAMHAYFSQTCTFQEGRNIYKTDQHYYGDSFYFKDATGERSSWAQYKAADADPAPTETFIHATITQLSEENGPQTVSSDGCYQTTTWGHKEKVRVRYFSAEAEKELGYSLGVGEELNLDCQDQTDEPIGGPNCQ